ncbi:hypothetical protein [Bradyrhizobium elkanii]|uniref:hypothetical protein n=1 Tax=Bradyrhizobium elkanii TaxID=29448 RepID=UPI0012FD536A
MASRVLATTSGPSIGWSRKFAKSRSSRRSGSASGSFGNLLTSFKPYQQVLPPFFFNLLPEGPRMSNLSVGNGLEERNRDPTAFRDFEAKGLAAALRHGAGDQGTG